MENISRDNDNFTSTISVEEDFFRILYSDTPLKQATIAVFFIATIFGLLLESGIIWYERNGNHRYRTVINQLFSTISWFVIWYILLVYIPDGVRYLNGPLNATFCSVHLFFKNGLTNCIVLTLDSIILLRYLFIFKISNFGFVNDDLVATFFQIAIFLLSMWMALVKMMSVGKMPLNYFMCSGKNPLVDSDDGIEKTPTIQKFDTTSILVLISFMLNIFAFVKIFHYKRNMERRTENIQLGRINPTVAIEGSVSLVNERKVARTSTMPKSMADLTTQILCMVFLIIPQIMIGIAISQIGPVNLNDYKHRWLTYYIQIIGVALSILVISVQYYIKNSTLTKAIWRNIKETFNF